MNCQEVMEYMQRQLDGDLDERETEILMNHTRHCSDCAAMFERLKLLSSGLENLPKVMPSYSLVDAILPKLAEMQASAEPVVPQPHIVIAGEEKAAPRRSKPAANGWRRWLPLSAAGGVVAAGVIIGMFFVSNQGMHSLHDGGNANMAADASTANASSSSSDKSAAADNSARADSGSNNAAASGDSGSSAKNSGNAAAQSPAGDPAQHDEMSMKSLSTNVDPNGEPMPPITGGGQNSNDVAPDAMASSGNQTFVQQNNGSGATDDGAASDSAVSDGKQDGGAANGDTAKNTTGQAAGNDMTRSNEIAPQVMASPISPNKQYQAFIVEDAVSVYTVSDSVPVFLGKKHAGISELKWSDDSSRLTYAAVQADGTKKTYVIDPKAGTELEQSSK